MPSRHSKLLFGRKDWERILPRLDPRIVVPTHYDNFFSPLGRPQDFVRRVNLAAVSDEVMGAPATPGSRH